MTDVLVVQDREAFYQLLANPLGLLLGFISVISKVFLEVTMLEVLHGEIDILRSAIFVPAEETDKMFRMLISVV